MLLCLVIRDNQPSNNADSANRLSQQTLYQQTGGMGHPLAAGINQPGIIEIDLVGRQDLQQFATGDLCLDTQFGQQADPGPLEHRVADIVAAVGDEPAADLERAGIEVPAILQLAAGQAMDQQGVLMKIVKLLRHAVGGHIGRAGVTVVRGRATNELSFISPIWTQASSP